MADPSIPIAFAAGLVSFLSPCVLPLVPGYLSYMSGFSTSRPSGERSLHPAMAAFSFVVGFTLVFVALGMAASLLGSLLRDNQRLLTQLSGALIVLLGLVFMGVIRIPALMRERRFHPRPEVGIWGSGLLGGAFAFGWSPCIGATMGAVLAMAAGRGTGSVAEGAGLLAVYSLGLGVPFLLAGIGVSRLTSAVQWLHGHIKTVNLVSGVLLVAVGLLFMTGQLFRLSIWMQKSFTTLGLDFWSSF